MADRPESRTGALARALAASSVLEVGARGVLDGVPFSLTGRSCVRGRRGALWNEWTVRLDDGRVRWLAEVNGGLVLYVDATFCPSFEQLVPGRAVDTGFVVVERGEATRALRWGDAADLATTYRYVDLSGRDGTLATLDYGDDAAPSFYSGARRSFASLALTPARPHPALLPVPEVSRPSGVEIWLEPGDEGTLDGRRTRVLGVIARSVDASGVTSAWEEYLVHSTDDGFRWLVVADGHWSIGTTLDAGLVDERSEEVAIGSDTFVAIGPPAKAVVRWAAGALPWDVGIGDQTIVQDFAGEQGAITKETAVDELGFTRSVSIPTENLARAFGRALPRPR